METPKEGGVAEAQTIAFVFFSNFESWSQWSPEKEAMEAWSKAILPLGAWSPLNYALETRSPRFLRGGGAHNVKVFEICNYADDTTTYACDNNIEGIIETLESDALKIAEWFPNNCMKLNEDKCHLMIFGDKSNDISYVSEV